MKTNLSPSKESKVLDTGICGGSGSAGAGVKSTRVPVSGLCGGNVSARVRFKSTVPGSELCVGSDSAGVGVTIASPVTPAGVTLAAEDEKVIAGVVKFSTSNESVINNLTSYTRQRLILINR